MCPLLYAIINGRLEKNLETGIKKSRFTNLNKRNIRNTYSGIKQLFRRKKMECGLKKTQKKPNKIKSLKMNKTVVIFYHKTTYSRIERRHFIIKNMQIK